MALAVDDITGRCQAALAEHTPTLAVRDALHNDADVRWCDQT